KIVDNTIITDEKGIYTCGGGYSYLNLLLYIIEKHLGREISILASKMFEIDIERKSQNPFMIFVGQKRHGDEIVLKALQFSRLMKFVIRLVLDEEHLKDDLKRTPITQY